MPLKYPADIAPTVIIEIDQYSEIRLVLLCHDRAPGVIYLHKNWDRMCYELEILQSRISRVATKMEISLQARRRLKKGVGESESALLRLL